MGYQQYALHSNIAFVQPSKTGRSPTYPLNPTHGDISVTDRQYQNNLHKYHLVKNMNIALKKIFIAAIDNQWIKGTKYMVMGYSKKSFVELMDWLYVWYGQIMLGYLMKNQGKYISDL